MLNYKLIIDVLYIMLKGVPHVTPLVNRIFTDYDFEKLQVILLTVSVLDVFTGYLHYLFV